MKRIEIFDPAGLHEQLLPMTYTRPVGALRVGILTVAEKWQLRLPGEYGWKTAEYLTGKFGPLPQDDSRHTLSIAGNLLPDDALVAAVDALAPGQALMRGGRLLAACTEAAACMPQFDTAGLPEGYEGVEYAGQVLAVDYLYDIFELNGRAIVLDFDLLTAGRASAPLSPSVTVIGDPSLIFLEPGAQAEGCVINTKQGPVYLGEGAEIMEGSCVRGPLAVGTHSTVQMGAKVYPNTTLGPWCKVGGELNNVVFQGYSNKAHDGFLGNAVIGEWCNLGAGCTASNLKNDYTKIRLWHYPTRRFMRTDLQFCGLIMGDHSKAGINTMFNTATVVGVGCNIHGSGYPRNFVASFLEGGTSGFTNVPLSKVMDIAQRAMARRGIELTECDRQILEAIYDSSDSYR